MISIGTVISGREIYAVYDNQYCIAKDVGEISPEPFTVWHIDHDGNGVHTGKYFKFGDDAERHFAWLCFDWFSDEQEEPASEGEAPKKILKQMIVNTCEEANRLLQESWILKDVFEEHKDNGDIDIAILLERIP